MNGLVDPYTASYPDHIETPSPASYTAQLAPISGNSNSSKPDTASSTAASSTAPTPPTGTGTSSSTTTAANDSTKKQAEASSSTSATPAAGPKKRKWTIEERSQHSVVEKRRREDLNLKLLTLARNLPTLATKKRLSKGIIAQGAIDHVLHERELILESIPEIRQLIKQNVELISEVNEWRRRNGLNVTVKSVNESAATVEDRSASSKSPPSNPSLPNFSKAQTAGLVTVNEEGQSVVYNKNTHRLISEVEKYTYNAFPGGFTGADGENNEDKEGNSATSSTAVTTHTLPNASGKPPTRTMSGSFGNITSMAAAIPLPSTPASTSSALPPGIRSGGSAISKSTSLPLPLGGSFLSPALGNNNPLFPSASSTAIGSSNRDRTTPAIRHASNSLSASTSRTATDLPCQIPPPSLSIDAFDLSQFFETQSQTQTPQQQPQQTQQPQSVSQQQRPPPTHSSHSFPHHQQRPSGDFNIHMESPLSNQISLPGQLHPQQHGHSRPHSASYSQAQPPQTAFSPMHTNTDLPFDQSHNPTQNQASTSFGSLNTHFQPSTSQHPAMLPHAHFQPYNPYAGSTSHSTPTGMTANLGGNQQNTSSMQGLGGSMDFLSAYANGRPNTASNGQDGTSPASLAQNSQSANSGLAIDAYGQFPMSSSNLDFLSQWPRDFNMNLGNPSPNGSINDLSGSLGTSTNLDGGS